jgi:nucleoside-diphosphate-sugar epimerase
MRVLVTGPTNTVGAAVVRALASAGHEVRAFGVEPGADPFRLPNVAVFPGRVDLGGSMEPAASECQALVHCALFDAVPGSKTHRAMVMENGTLFARYTAERELVQRFVAVFPAQGDKADAQAFARAEAHVRATRPAVPYATLRAASPEAAAKEVLAALAPLASMPPSA